MKLGLNLGLGGGVPTPRLGITVNADQTVTLALLGGVVPGVTANGDQTVTLVSRGITKPPGVVANGDMTVTLTNPYGG